MKEPSMVFTTNKMESTISPAPPPPRQEFAASFPCQQPSTSSGSTTKHEMAPLSNDFIPGRFDVICARGAKVKQHAGNQLFRQKIQESVQAYAASADSKLYKSMVVSGVVDFFQEHSQGGFVKQKKDGVWYRVGDSLAREKVGQAIREQLSHQYRSSTKAKRRRWKQEEREVMTSVLRNINTVKMQRDREEEDAVVEGMKRLEQPSNEKKDDADEEDPPSSSSSSSSSLSHFDAEEEDEEEAMEEDGKFLTMFTQNNMKLLGKFQGNQLTETAAFVDEEV
jgi:hypothetical protein